MKQPTYKDPREFTVLNTPRNLYIDLLKSQLFETRHGANFLGFRVIPLGEIYPKDVRIRVRRENLRRGKRRLKQL